MVLHKSWGIRVRKGWKMEPFFISAGIENLPIMQQFTNWALDKIHDLCKLAPSANFKVYQFEKEGDD